MNHREENQIHPTPTGTADMVTRALVGNVGPLELFVVSGLEQGCKLRKSVRLFL